MILGVDPGTTVGFALLDFSGEVVHIESKRQLSLGSLIDTLIGHGRVLVVGCDKAKAPSFVQDVATKLGARLVFPDEDLQVREKRDMTKLHACKNAHEMDALASALFAYKKTEGLLRKVGSLLKREGKLELFDDVVSLVLREGVSIKHALVFLTSSPEEVETVEQSSRFKEDVRRVYDSLIEAREENRSLRSRLSALERKNKLLEIKNKKLEKRSESLVKPKSRGIIKYQHERKLSALNKRLESKESELGSAKSMVSFLEMAVCTGDKKAVPRLPRLSWNAVRKHARADVLFVDDANEFSQKAVDLLSKNNIRFVICKRLPSAKTKKRLPFPCVKADKFEATDNIVLVKKSWIKKQSRKLSVLEKVVEEYKKSRANKG